MNTILMGDFNVPKFILNSRSDFKTSIILNFLDIFELEEVNNIGNYLNQCLDLIMSHFSCNVEHDDCLLVSEDVHHPALVVSVLHMFERVPKFGFNSETKAYNFRRADFDSLYTSLLNTD